MHAWKQSSGTGWLPVFALLVILAMPGCRSNVEDYEPITDWSGPFVTIPTGMAGGETATWSVSWMGGVAPHTVAMDMGGGTTENVPAGTVATSPFSHEFTMVNPDDQEAHYTYSLTITDATGSARTATAVYTVGPAPNHPPVIVSAVFTEAMRTLTVNVSDPDPDDVLAVTVTVPEGLAVDDDSKIAAQVSQSASFVFSATDLLSGGAGDVTVTVDDGCGGTDSETVAVSISVGPIPIGALVAIPSKPSCTVGEQVVVAVASGGFPADAPFHYMDGVGVTYDVGASYVQDTFNPGVPGGTTGDIDGLWATLNPPATGFISVQEFMLVEMPLAADPGRQLMCFNLTPIGGGNTTASGVLLNFALTFDHAGTYTLGFEDFQDVRRTYYSDATGMTHDWGDISNSSAPNTITVTE